MRQQRWCEPLPVGVALLANDSGDAKLRWREGNVADHGTFWSSRGLRETPWSWRFAALFSLTYAFLGITSLVHAVQSSGWGRAFWMVGVLSAVVLVPVWVDAVVWKYRKQRV